GPNLSGSVGVTGNVGSLSVVGTMTNTAVVSAGSLTAMTVGPNLLAPGHDMAGQILVSSAGLLGDLRVSGGTPGTIVAGHVGTVRVYGGYGPVVLQINEAGIQRRVEAAVPGMDYPIPPPPPAAPPPISPRGVTFQYDYESGS